MIVSIISRALNLHPKFSKENLEADLEEYHGTLTKKDSNGLPMPGPEVTRFKESLGYNQWNNSKSSSLLVLSGHSSPVSATHPYSWVSETATNLIYEHHGKKDQKLTKPGSESFYSYYLMSYQMYSSIPPGRLIHDVLPSILLQLLRSRAEALRNTEKYKNLISQLKTYSKLREAKSSASEVQQWKKGRVSFVEMIAVSIIEFFNVLDTIYIFIDRADLCFEQDGEDDRTELLRILIKMVKNSRAKLRILTVYNSDYWDVSPLQNQLQERLGDRIIFYHMEQEPQKDNQSHHDEESNRQKTTTNEPSKADVKKGDGHTQAGRKPTG